MKTYNLKDDREMSFDANTTSAWAVAYGYCEDNNLMSWLFRNAQDNTLEAAFKELPIKVCKHSISCGDWAAVNDGLYANRTA